MAKLKARHGRRLARISVLALALGLLTACGAQKQSASLSGRRLVPRGYTIYRSQGFTFAYPSGWRLSRYQSDPTQGGVSVVPPGSTPAGDAFPQIDTELSAARASYPPPQDFNTFIANIRDETTFTLPSGQTLARSVSVATVKVPGATAAKLCSVLAPDQRHELALVVLLPKGVIELSVAWYPSNQRLSPQTVIDSLRLNA